MFGYVLKLLTSIQEHFRTVVNFIWNSRCFWFIFERVIFGLTWKYFSIEIETLGWPEAFYSIFFCFASRFYPHWSIMTKSFKNYSHSDLNLSSFLIIYHDKQFYSYFSQFFRATHRKCSATSSFMESTSFSSSSESSQTLDQFSLLLSTHIYGSAFTRFTFAQVAVESFKFHALWTMQSN